MKTTFRYNKSFKIIYKGCIFHSLLELKYALSIEDNYRFLREHIHIWYDPRTCQPTTYIRENTRKYVPDFLVRNKRTNKAYLVEIKPRAFTDYYQLRTRQRVAENYIKANGFDWEFKVVYDDEVRLNHEQWKAFKELCELKSQAAFKIKLQQQDRLYNRQSPSYSKSIPRGDRNELCAKSWARFVIYGKPDAIDTHL